MDEANAAKVLDFIEKHYDFISQQDWFEFCDMLMGMAAESANRDGWAEGLAERHPKFFRCK